MGVVGVERGGGRGGGGGYISGIAQAGGEEEAAKERQRCAGREDQCVEWLWSLKSEWMVVAWRLLLLRFYPTDWCKYHQRVFQR